MARVDPEDIAARLAPAIDWPGASCLAERTWRLVAATADFDAWLIAWPEGKGLELHDHGASAGAVSVVSGTLTETVPSRDDAGRLTTATRILDAGSTTAFAAGHVHDVTNRSGKVAVSLHVYSPPLATMTHYEIVGDQLTVRSNTVRAVSDRGRAEHPAGGSLELAVTP